MTELRLRFALPDGGADDLVARFGPQTTVGQVADEIARSFDPGDHDGAANRTLMRTSRGERTFERDARLARSDLRSGDTVSLAVDGGHRADPGTDAIALLRVVDGPDAGRVHELRRGESTVGRSPRCDVPLTDDLASRRHAMIRVSDVVEVADAGSTNGIAVNGTLVSGWWRLRPGDRLLVGDTTMVIELAGRAPTAADVVDNAVGFNRPPRLVETIEAVKVELPAPVDPPARQSFPVTAAVVPLMMGAVLYALTRNVASLVFVALSPAMAAGSLWEQRRSARRDHHARRAEQAAVLRDRVAQLDHARDTEVARRHRRSPGPHHLVSLAAQQGDRLWERRPDDPDFLSLRLGTRPQASSIEVAVQAGGPHAARAELEQLATAYATLPPVPAVVDARHEAPVALVGPYDVIDGVARSLLVQAATLHSPRDLLVAALVPEPRQATWEWLKWLPHNARPLPGTGRSLDAVGPVDGVELVAALDQVLAGRRERQAATAEPPSAEPHLLVVIDGATGIERSRLARLLEDGPPVGISVLWLSDDARLVPHACNTTITVEPGHRTLTVATRAGARLGGVPIEPVSVEAADAAALGLGPAGRYLGRSRRRGRLAGHGEPGRPARRSRCARQPGGHHRAVAGVVGRAVAAGPDRVGGRRRGVGRSPRGRTPRSGGRDHRSWQVGAAPVVPGRPGRHPQPRATQLPPRRLQGGIGLRRSGRPPRRAGKPDLDRPAPLGGPDHRPEPGAGPAGPHLTPGRAHPAGAHPQPSPDEGPGRNGRAPACPTRLPAC